MMKGPVFFGVLLVLASALMLGHPVFGQETGQAVDAQINDQEPASQKTFSKPVSEATTAWIYEPGEMPWVSRFPGVRRQVFQTENMTFIRLEIDRPVQKGQPLGVHSHEFEQIVHLIEGKALVQVGGLTREVGPGSTWTIPANMPHAMQHRSPRLVVLESFYPRREDHQAGAVLGGHFTEESVSRLVAAWFALFDRNAAVEEFLPLIIDEKLEMRFPERNLRCHADFRDWHAGIVKTFRKASHEVSEIRIKTIRPGTWQVALTVLWRAEPFDGKPVSMRVRQHWVVKDRGGPTPMICSYLVRPLWK